MKTLCVRVRPKAWKKLKLQALKHDVSAIDMFDKVMEVW